MQWQEIVQNYIIKHSDKIREATRPLRDRFHVQYFTYHRIDEAGKYTVLVDRPDWAVHYVEEKFYLADPFLRTPEVYKSGFCFVENHGPKEHWQRVLKDGKEIFNLDQGVVLIQKNSKFVEFFGFAGNKRDASLDQLHMNHPWILKNFADYFKSKMQPLLFQMEGEADTLQNLKGKDFFVKEPIYPDLKSDDLVGYLKDVGSESVKIGQLSPREKECVKLLVQGKSAKESASLLKLSPRTIEFYFENIKNKLLCSSKQEIVVLAKDFQELLE